MKTTTHIDPAIAQIEFRNELPFVELGKFDCNLASAMTQPVMMVSDGKWGILPVTIDSHGGEVFSLMGILDQWDQMDAIICTYARGKAESCGAIALAFGTKGYRFISPRCTYMLHSISFAVEGKSHEVENSTKYAMALQERLFTDMASRCGKEPEFFLRLLKDAGNTDLYLTPEQVVEYGIADHIGAPTIHQSVTASVTLEHNGRAIWTRTTAGVSE